ncbi:ATP-grasp domain-containing protein [Saccharomonospora azurea]|uniref:ATP-grasp domain-containing protein n=1 Tax=Saccharomonospora azurea TaxID=40988 RepID=UPI000255FAB3|nr:ATP-grasp domain-containing protein [Saccharomonospora azurea]
MKNIFVLALDDENTRTLYTVPGAENYRFHSLLTVDETQVGEIDVDALFDKAVSELDAFDGSVDAIVSYWDFPSSTLRAMLCERYGLPGPSVESVVKCEHKYWSRLEQQKSIDEYPHFGIVDLDERRPRPPEGVRYPMWLKPVKSYSSELAFLARDDAEFDDAVARIREGIGRIGKAFDSVLDRLDLPSEIREVGGQACLAEEALSGVQCATEGYVHNGEVVVYGVLDSIDYPGHSSFLRHQYPSQLPAESQRRLRDVSQRVISQIGMDNSTFSIEFFCDPSCHDVALLEINPRHSQSHAEMFECVDGIANHHAMVQLGLGRDPELPSGEGPYNIAAKWYHRRFVDGVVSSVPSAEDIERVRGELGGVEVDIVPKAGQRLSDLSGQDSYSYELAHIFVGARDETDLVRKYERCVDALPFGFEDH